MTQQPNILQIVERETRAYSIDSGGPDILGGPSLFCVVAILQGRIRREEALRATVWGPVDFTLFPGARCPGYSVPVQIGCETAARELRDLELDDLWHALRAYDPSVFKKLLQHYSIQP